MSPAACCRRTLIASARVIALSIFVFWVGGICGGFLELHSAAAAQPPSLTPSAELSAAARDYRIEIYGAFRTNRAEYDLRRKQGEALLAEWQGRGALPDEAAVLVRWFDTARRAAAQQQPLPPPPNWNGAVTELLPIPPRRHSPSAASQVLLLRALPSQRARVERQVELTAISQRILNPRESKFPLNLLAAMPETSSLSLVLAADDSARGELASAVPLSKREAQTPVPISQPTLALPAAKLNPNTLPGTTPRTTTDETAELNTAELSARLRGYDKAWRALQADLYSDEEFTLERGVALLTILNDLGQARRDLLLYQAIAPVEMRDEVRGLAALDELQKQLHELIEKARANTAADQALEPGQRAALDRAWLKLLESK